MAEKQNVDKLCRLVFEKDLRIDFHVLCRHVLTQDKIKGQRRHPPIHTLFHW